MWLVLAILIFAPLATGAVRALEFTVVQSLTVGVLLLWLVRVWLQEQPTLYWPPICWAVLAFVGYAVFRYATADIEFVARQELLRVLVYAALFFAILNNLQRPDTLTLIVRVMVFLGMLVAGYAVYQYVTGDNRVWHFINPYEKRGSGTFINPNHLAGFLELLLPVGLAFVVMGRPKPVVGILLGYAVAVIAVGIAVSFSRGGWLATAASLVVFFTVLMFQQRYRWPALLVVVLTLGAAITFFTQSIHSRYRLARVFSSDGGVDTELRSDLWRPALAMWRDNPWLGVGPGHFDYRFPEYRPANVQARPDRAHNDYMNTLADWGVVGLTLVGVAWLVAFDGGVRTWRRLSRDDPGQEGSNRLAFVLGSLSALVAILVHSFTDFNMHIPSNAILVVTWMAFLSLQLRYVKARGWVENRAVARGAVSVGLACLVFVLGWQAEVRAREWYWLDRAKAAEANSMVRAELLKRAHAVQPGNFETAHAIGEIYRAHSFWGGEEWEAEATEALHWYGVSGDLNPKDAYSALHYGMCLDWLGRWEEAIPYYDRADQLDPRGYFTAAHIGWHYMHREDYPAAQAWFERSLRLEPDDNPVATTHLQLIRERLLQSASTNSLLEALRARPATPE